MEISNSEEKFLPTTDWMKEKYDELNKWLFGGRLGNCLFEIYTTGKGAERSLGHFRFTGSNIKYDRRTREMYWSDPKYGGSLKFPINNSNFVHYTQPMIGFNGHYKRTEHMWLNTLVHEMCHYYTYMNGYVPVQAHGKEFRNIAAVVGHRSGGVFEIKRLCDAENVGELDGDIVAKRQARDDKKKSKMTALLIFMRNGEIRLVTTTKKSLISDIVRESNGLTCKKIVATSDIGFIEYLWSRRYKNNMSTYRYWALKDNSVVNELKKYNSETLKSYENMFENIQLTMEDINIMVESALKKIMGKEDELCDITPDMILSDDSGLEK